MTLKNIVPPKGFLDAESKELVVSRETKAYWAVLLDLAFEFDRVCRKHGIRYCMDSGTLLGAVRHGGFIPWDDDIDLIMTRDEYKRLEKIAQSEFSYPFFFQTTHTDKESARGHAQLRRTDTAGILKSEMCSGKCLWRFNQGVFLDVFVLDKVPDDLAERQTFMGALMLQKEKIRRMKTAISCFRNFSLIGFSLRNFLWAMRGFFWILWERLCGHSVIERASLDLEQMAQRYDACACKYCAPIEYRPHRKPTEYFLCADVIDLEDRKFEFLTLLAPRRYEGILCAYYGDWHRHVIGGSVHGDILVDLDKSYVEYF